MGVLPHIREGEDSMHGGCEGTHSLMAKLLSDAPLHDPE